MRSKVEVTRGTGTGCLGTIQQNRSQCNANGQVSRARQPSREGGFDDERCMSFPCVCLSSGVLALCILLLSTTGGLDGLGAGDGDGKIADRRWP